MTALLVDLGVDINASKNPRVIEGPILEAAGNGSVEVVRWMIDHGAVINHRVDDVLRCDVLSNAVMDGHLEVVKMLVEAGAAINAVSNGYSSLSFALMFGHKEIEQYLRSVGAIEPPKEASESEDEPSALFDYIKEHFGEPRPLSIGEVLPSERMVFIRIVEAQDCLILITDGMSNEPLKACQEDETPEFAEVLICLPTDWEITPNSLNDPALSWPIILLRQIATSTRDDIEFADPNTFLIANSEFGSETTEFTDIMAKREEGVGRLLELPDGRLVGFYALWPLYPEERDLCLAFGSNALQRLFERRSVSRILNPGRENVAISQS
ncbi:Suppressor of fused protein (SUFU) [Singulisphaera acidiphila DSM 18658]|uniref:Suppressor of fused protein (SUFU) n=2 Tax=Singulisphaera acidiphila TaxID=466153 RepID=L0DB90_SINAD|nr:Suppressor of fused protein (SUFU) [Singulisphaera acidiphila DSM 18658]